MNQARIEIRGLRASGSHGASAGEKDQPQEFIIDLDVAVVVGADELDRTGDYRTIIEEAQKVIESESYELLETVAHAVALAVQRIPSVKSVSATVHKPEAAARLGLSDLAATATAG